VRARLVQRKHVRALFVAFLGPLAGVLLGLGADPHRWIAAERGFTFVFAMASAFSTLAVVALGLATILPFVILHRRDPRVDVRLAADRIHLGRSSILASNVTGFSVVPDGPSFSVAIGTRYTTRFLEVESLEDARRIAAALNVSFPLHEKLLLWVPQRPVTSILGMCAVVDICLAFMVGPFGEKHASNALLGGLMIIGFLMYFLTHERLRDSMLLAWGKLGRQETATSLDRNPLEHHARLHQEGHLKADPAPPRVRIDLLSRGGEAIPAWLSRLDRLEREEGYRGAHTPREVLYESVNDVHIDIDVRLAAARLLRVRDHEESWRILEGIRDSDVRARIEAVTIDDSEAAAERLEEIGVRRARG
jgi:hypothetical protein